jgi:tetratricopeptide (TPR) repeat protein
MIAGRLRAEHYLLMLDNLESITGAHLAIQHTLPKEEQDALHSFLSDLARGKTRVLLGSRSGEEWLAKGTFDDNIYDLTGLDDEAASMLADRILEKCNATQYRHDERLRTLIKLLDGFPLAMEVVLANLAKQTPQEILEALQAGDVKIDPQSDSQEKTASILRCIDYSHSNLSPEAQQLLLWLAPFTSVIWTDMLNDYTEQLHQQTALSALPFASWPEVIREAQNWGLLSPHRVPGFLHLQPTLTYFLRHRLHESGQAEVKQAIEAAFLGHYDQLGGMLNQLLNSKESQEKQVGQSLTGLEYENLVTALNLALEVQVSISNIYNALMQYFIATQNQRRGLELFQSVLERFERYPAEKLARASSTQLINLIGTIANWQLNLKQFTSAEASYQKIVTLVQQLGNLDEQQRNRLKAQAYHQLGMAAQEQRQWQQAEQYYQQALQIKIEYNDRYEQAGIYHQLGRVAEEQQKWQPARSYFLTALTTFVDYNDTHSSGVVLRSIARLWQASGDAGLPADVAPILGGTVEETEALLREGLEE